MKYPRRSNPPRMEYPGDTLLRSLRRKLFLRLSVNLHQS
jgi:hypothetical protein